MPRIKQVTVSGNVLEQEIFYVAPNTQKLKESTPKPQNIKTDDEKEEYNRKQSLKRFIRIVNTNFSPSAFYVTNTFDDAHLPADFKGARRFLDNYFRRLQYAFPLMVAVAVMGRGKRSGRIHIHCIISGPDEKTIREKWTGGAVVRADPLREHNYYSGVDRGRDYEALAIYLFNHWTDEQGNSGKRWKQTKTIQPPDKKKPTKPKRQYSIDKPPITPKGYILVEARESKHYTGGYLCFRYVKEPPPAQGDEFNMLC